MQDKSKNINVTIFPHSLTCYIGKLYSFIAAIMLVSLSCMAKDDSSLFAKAQALAAPLPELSTA